MWRKPRFLHCDFATVREFEMAIRKTIPINEEALVTLDRAFAETRYSRREMGNAHKCEAQQALGSSRLNRREKIRSSSSGMEARSPILHIGLSIVWKTEFTVGCCIVQGYALWEPNLYS